MTQLLVSVAFSKSLDRFGVRPHIIPALCVFSGGLAFFALAPDLFPSDIFAGLALAIIVYAGGGRLLELCLSPIVDAIPSDAADSSKALSALHSYYAWGQAAVVLLTTALLHFGVSWRAVALCWIAVPAADAVLFARAPIAERAAAGAATPVRELLRLKVFIIALAAIMSGGAAESVIAQYASSFLEKGLGFAKITGDILGLCGFAVFLGAGRLLYGLFGDRINISSALMAGSALAFAAYIVIVFSPAGAPSVAAIALCGLFVSLMWPGALAIASKALPMAGASMFALLAAAGSLGCSLGPWIGGIVTDLSMKLLPQGAGMDAGQSGIMGIGLFKPMSIGLLRLLGAGQSGLMSAEQFGLRAGLLACAVFPLASFVTQLLLKRKTGEK